MQARAELAADDLRPHEVGVDARLQGFDRDAALLNHLGELLRAHAGAARDVGVGAFDFALRYFGDVALAEVHLELVLDQLFEHLVARGGLLRR